MSNLLTIESKGRLDDEFSASKDDWDDEFSAHAPGKESGGQEHADDIKAIGFALLHSAAMLPEFAIPKRPQNCIDCATFDIMRLTHEDVKVLEDIMQCFFTRRPGLQSTPPRADSKAARVLKTRSEIADAWRLILERRRLVELDDTRPITDPHTLADMYTSWMHEWLDENLTEKQCRLKASKQSSIFAAYLNNNLGGKHFVMALWQTGVQWAPPPAMLVNDQNGALEHVAKNFTKWTHKLARAVTLHKNDADTQEARRRSGSSFGKHGLSAEEEKNRKERHDARTNYYWAMDLNRQLLAYEGEGHKKSTSVTPKPWSDMSRNDRWYLKALWSGSLLAEMRRAEGKCSKVQAKDFFVDE